MENYLKFNLTPLAISEAGLVGDLTEATVKQSAAAKPQPFGGVNTQAGVITIKGALYPDTYRRIEGMLDILAQECSAIILDIDSPGGMVAGCFDLSDKIYLLRQKVPIYSFVGDRCFSAAFSLASASTKIYLARSAGVGSVGVIAVHVDQSGLHDKIGLKFTPVYAGARKIDGSPLGPLSERAMSDLQKSIDDSYKTFCQIVGRNRGVLASTVKQTEAGIFYGQDAIKAGLVDCIASRTDAFKYIAQEISKGGQTASATKPKESMVPSVPAKAKTFDPDLLKKDAIKRVAAAAPAPSKSTKQPIHSMSVSTSYLH